LQAFDSQLAAQTRQTVELCHQVATAAGLSSELREGLVAAAWFHDLGLIALSRRGDDTSKPRDCSAAGFLDHPAVSERLALAAGLAEAVAQGVRGHHESFDGGGFPDRLRAQHIPEIARWLTPVAYFVESGLKKQDAIEEIEKLSGVAFDPNVVRTFLKIAIGLPSRASAGPGIRQASGLSSTIRCA
jgi:HD-GYP domain-containing protein (c-di-GMP phosphodiesterase class II)